MKDEGKGLTWPLARWPAGQAEYRHHHRVRVRIVVITHSRSVARGSIDHEPIALDTTRSVPIHPNSHVRF